MTGTRILHSLEETSHWGKQLGQSLFPGTVVLLSGTLGAGKTTLCRAICEGLQVCPEEVTSPTYTIVHQYQGRYPVYHVDLYRLSGPGDLDAFDEEDLIAREGITLVEWPQWFESFLGDEPKLKLELNHLSEESRSVSWTFTDPRFNAFLENS